MPSVMHVHEHGTGWFKWTASAILVFLIVNGYAMKLLSYLKERKNDRKKEHRMKANISTYRVEGMTCDHCKATVEKGLKDLQGVTEVLADRNNGQVRVQAERISDDRIKQTIEKLGYSFMGRLDE